MTCSGMGVTAFVIISYNVQRTTYNVQRTTYNVHLCNLQILHDMSKVSQKQICVRRNTSDVHTYRTHPNLECWAPL